MKHQLLLLLMLLLFVIACKDEGTSSIDIVEVPKWVTYDMPDTSLHLPYVYGKELLLDDYQVNVKTKEEFHRAVYRVGYEDIKYTLFDYFEYDSKGQEGVFHEAFIYRNGEKINAKPILTKEVNEELLIDTYVYIQFESLQIGDIIDFSYSIKGRPDECPGYLAKWRLNPVSSVRVLLEESDTYIYKLVGNTQPSFSEQLMKNGMKEWVWKYEDISEVGQKYRNEQMKRESMPSWYYNGIATLYVSPFNSLEKLHELYYPNFQYTELSKLVKDQAISITTEKSAELDKIEAIFHFIQKEIHHKEEGYYKPSSTDNVLDQKLGDCKSKSYLTVQMLDAIGVKASPIIVDINGFDLAVKDFYSPQIFNHCIVEYEHKGNLYYFDPVLQVQHGVLGDRYLPNYRLGLRVAPNQDSLVVIPPSRANKIRVQDKMVMKERFNNWARINRTISVEGDYADTLRRAIFAYGKMQAFNDFEPFGNYKIEGDDPYLYAFEVVDSANFTKSNKIVFSIYLDQPGFIGYGRPKDVECIESAWDILDYFPSEWQDSTYQYYRLYGPAEFEYELDVKSIKEADFEWVNTTIETPFMYFSRRSEPIEHGGRFHFHVKTYDDYFRKEDWPAYRAFWKQMSMTSQACFKRNKH